MVETEGKVAIDSRLVRTDMDGGGQSNVNTSIVRGADEMNLDIEAVSILVSSFDQR